MKMNLDSYECFSKKGFEEVNYPGFSGMVCGKKINERASIFIMEIPGERLWLVSLVKDNKTVMWRKENSPALVEFEVDNMLRMIKSFCDDGDNENA